MKNKIVLLCLIATLAACGGTPTVPNYYLLRSASDLETRKLTPSEEYGIGTIGVASYLDRGGLVMETDEGEIHQARNHLWAEPLSESLRAFMAIEISAAAGQDVLFDSRHRAKVRIDIGVNQLHATREGVVVLAGFWRLETASSKVVYQFSDSMPLPGDGYQALASAERDLLARFAGAIAASLDTPEEG